MRKRLGIEVTLVEADLFGLVDGERTAAIDALMRGDALPFVILGDKVICTGGLDGDAVAAAVQRSFDSKPR